MKESNYDILGEAWRNASSEEQRAFLTKVILPSMNGIELKETSVEALSVRTAKFKQEVFKDKNPTLPRARKWLDKQRLELDNAEKIDVSSKLQWLSEEFKFMLKYSDEKEGYKQEPCTITVRKYKKKDEFDYGTFFRIRSISTLGKPRKYLSTPGKIPDGLQLEK